MSRIRIKNFGPIKEGLLENDGWIDIKKVTLFIGNQGSGKSTVAKLMSTFTWMEKALNRGDLEICNSHDILKQIAWHNLQDYLHIDSFIEYQGSKYSIIYNAAAAVQFEVNEIADTSISESYIVPKIIYIPAERNFLSTIKEAFDLSGLPDPLSDFSTELRKAQYNVNGSMLPLPVNQVNYEFNKQEGNSYISGNGYKLNLLSASSGFHSLVPMYLVTNYLIQKIQKEDLPEKADLSTNNRVKREEEISALFAKEHLSEMERANERAAIYSKYHNRCLFNITEELEQNLFPTSQKEVLYSMLAFNNQLAGNNLILTTHSPYLINDLTLAIEAYNLLQKIKDSSYQDVLSEQVYRIVPKDSTVNGADVAIYEMDEKTGTIALLGNYNGLPSDNNQLNNQLGGGNELFAELLEIEQQL